MKKSIILFVMTLLVLTLCVPVQAETTSVERVTYLAEDITNAQELLVRAERGIDERSERLKESGKIVAWVSGQLADDAEVRHAMQLQKRAELGEGKIEETYQTTAVVKSRSGSNGKDNFAAYVKIYWRVESDSTLPIDEYYFVRSEHWFAINGSYSAT